MNNASKSPERKLARRLAGTVAAAALGLAISASAALAQDKAIAKVDDIVITEMDLIIAAEDLASSMPQGSTDAQKRDYLVGYLVDLKLGARAAAQAKIGENPTFEKRVAYFREKLLLDDYLNIEAKKSVTPEALRKLYDESVKSMPPEEEVRARHILVPTEDEAKKAQARVKGGEDFGKVAGELSKDPGSGKEGGDLGFFTKDRMVPEFAEAAFKMQPGQVSDPVKSQFGWHVIKVEEKRTKPAPNFEEVKDQVEQYLTRKTQSDVIMALRAKGKVERLDAPAAAPATPAAPGAAAPADPAKKP
jgi:peptidyl-prolyl cis-trans isomerase C